MRGGGFKIGEMETRRRGGGGSAELIDNGYTGGNSACLAKVKMCFVSHSQVLLSGWLAVRETAPANEHTGRFCLVVLLTAISHYCNQEAAAGSRLRLSNNLSIWVNCSGSESLVIITRVFVLCTNLLLNLWFLIIYTATVRVFVWFFHH